MTAWQPGMRCVCVDDSVGAHKRPHLSYVRSGLDGLMKGRVYTVAAVEWHADISALTLVLHEIVRKPVSFAISYRGFHVDRFRPLSEARLDQFRTHLAPVPTRETV